MNCLIFTTQFKIRCKGNKFDLLLFIYLNFTFQNCTYHIYYNLTNMNNILTFLGCHQLRKNENKSLGYMPKELVKAICTFAVQPNKYELNLNKITKEFGFIQNLCQLTINQPKNLNNRKNLTKSTHIALLAINGNHGRQFAMIPEYRILICDINCTKIHQIIKLGNSVNFRSFWIKSNKLYIVGDNFERNIEISDLSKRLYEFHVYNLNNGFFEKSDKTIEFLIDSTHSINEMYTINNKLYIKTIPFINTIPSKYLEKVTPSIPFKLILIKDGIATITSTPDDDILEAIKKADKERILGFGSIESKRYFTNTFVSRFKSEHHSQTIIHWYPPICDKLLYLDRPNGILSVINHQFIY